ncbi:MAG: RsmD family RNA methyltransferase [Chloroflexota bacterium]
MRVIGGSAKGRPLYAPRGLAVRPTADIVKGALFSMLESLLYNRIERPADAALSDVWEGLRWLDLYAGTGALAIEALSRGAAWADLVESSPTACRVIKRNLTETGFAASARTFCQSVQSFLAPTLAGLPQRRYDIIALDPPYADPAVADVLAKMAALPLLSEGGLLVVEHSRRLPLGGEAAPWVCVRERTHGDTVLSVFVRQEEAA